MFGDAVHMQPTKDPHGSMVIPPVAGEPQPIEKYWKRNGLIHLAVC